MRDGAPHPLPAPPVPGTLLFSEETTALHIHLYRARKRYRELVAAVADEAARRLPDARLLADLKARRDKARERALSLELAMQEPEAAPA